jgi:hypothetical protein
MILTQKSDKKSHHEHQPSAHCSILSQPRSFFILGIDTSFLLLGLFVVVVLAWVSNFVFEHLDEFVKQDCHYGAKTWSDPYSFVSRSAWEGVCGKWEVRLTVYPMFSIEDAGDDARAETASWVERATSIVYADEFGDEESEPDADGGDESSC